MLKWIQMGFALVAAATSGFILFQTASSFQKLSEHASVHGTAVGEEEASAHGGEAKEGEEQAEQGEKASGHAEEQGHGGEKASSGHGEADRKTASATALKGFVPFVSLDEVFANVNEDKISHTLAVKVDIEFFNVQAKETFKSNQPAVKHLIIQTSREQEYERLATLSGKLYFKELLIRKINDHFQKAIVRDVHFASFFLQ